MSIDVFYSHKFIHYLIANYCQHRTVDFIIPRKVDPLGIAFRYRRISRPDSVKFFFDKFQIPQKPFNIYSSNAKIDTQTFPIMSLEKDTAKLQREQINRDYLNYVTGYDLRIDIDNHEDFNLAYQDAGVIKQMLDDYHLPYWLMFSGTKGFNFTIDSRYVPIKDLGDLPAINLKIIETMGLRLGLKHRIGKDDTGKEHIIFENLDTSVYTLGRVFKVPYTVDRVSGMVALPLTDEQFQSFEKSDYAPEKVLAKIRLMNRGLLERPGTVDDVGKFYQDMSVGFSSEIKPQPEARQSFVQKVKGWFK